MFIEEIMDEHLLMRKYRLLYQLYEQLYGLILTQDVDKSLWDLYEYDSDGEQGCVAELKNTAFLPIDVRLQLHKYQYRKLKAQSNLKFTADGQISLLGFIV